MQKAQTQEDEQGVSIVNHLPPDVLAMVSHDLRSPLAVVLLTAALIENAVQGHQVDVDVGRRLELIRRAGKRMERLIDDLLDVTRLEHGALTLERRDENAA